MINIIGSFLGTSGYDIHCRELANALSKLTDVKITTPLQPNWEREVSDKELEMIKKTDDLEINLIITNPIYWKVNCSAKRNWVFLVWEGDKVPDHFIEECKNPDIEYIFVPSNHTLQAVLKTIIDNRTIEKAPKWLEKLKIMPHGVDMNKFYPKNKIRVDNLNNENVVPFTFLANKGFRNLEDRGGIQYLLKAYLEEFTKEDNVKLIIKINPAYGVNLKLFDEFDKKNKPKIKIISDNYDYDKLVNLYNQCDVFVSPTRAESFNLPCIESLACGKPVITTQFGGQAEYVTNENGWIIDGEMTEIKHELQYEGISWITPNIKELRKAMREAYNNPKRVLSKGLKGLETARLYSWDKTAKKIVSLI